MRLVRIVSRDVQYKPSYSLTGQYFTRLNYRYPSHRSLSEIVSPQLGKYCRWTLASGNIFVTSRKQFAIMTSTPVIICIIIQVAMGGVSSWALQCRSMTNRNYYVIFIAHATAMNFMALRAHISYLQRCQLLSTRLNRLCARTTFKIWLLLVHN